MKSAKENKIVLILFCVLLPVLLLLLSYKIILLATPITSAQENVFQFLQGQSALSSDFTALETSHLEDVARVMRYADYVFYALLLAIMIIIASYYKNAKFLIKIANYSGKTVVASMLLISVLSALFFDTVFSIFHRIFFPQGNWLFAADSAIIKTFPLDFFISLSRNIFLLTLFLGILFILLGYYFKDVDSDRN